MMDEREMGNVRRDRLNNLGPGISQELGYDKPDKGNPPPGLQPVSVLSVSPLRALVGDLQLLMRIAHRMSGVLVYIRLRC